jgi:hypothetical protein
MVDAVWGVFHVDRGKVRRGSYPGKGRESMNAMTAILSIFAASAAITLAITALANS